MPAVFALVLLRYLYGLEHVADAMHPPVRPYLE